MRAPLRVPYQPGVPLVARTSFSFAGVHFHPGDAFPGDRVAAEDAPERRRSAMWNSRMVEVASGASKVPAFAPPVVPKAPAKVPEVPAPVAEAYVAEHKGFGKWRVLVAATGEVAADDLGKAEAQAKAADLNSETRRGAGDAGAGEASSAASPAPVSHPHA